MGDGDAMAKYINVIKDIFKLNYGPISTPIIFMRCAWFRNGNDVKGNPTYRWDEARFLVCNFWYMMAKDEEPFGFLVQVQQVFFMESGGRKGISIALHHDKYFCYFEWH